MLKRRYDGRQIAHRIVVSRKYFLHNRLYRPCRLQWREMMGYSPLIAESHTSHLACSQLGVATRRNRQIPHNYP